ncbi:MAG: hypothetical protein LJE70_16005 [Chromatiaceae bacterium]|nr:hypothetical protein [Chromatiaceae bacterium]
MKNSRSSGRSTWWIIDNALSMLRPGGRLGAVDFYVSEAKLEPGLARHGTLAGMFSPRWLCP